MNSLFQSRRARHQDNQDPAEIPIRRPQALTTLLPGQSGFLKSLWPKQRTHTQSKSLFFTKLPLEIRLLIYEKLFGSRTVHPSKIRFYHRELEECHDWQWCHVVCSQSPHGDFWEDPCSVTWPGERLDTSMLLSCRQVYSESINILYGTNTFHFDNHLDFLEFRTFILSCSFESITSLFLRKYPYKDLSSELWEALASLPNLCQLFIVIACPPLQLDEYFGHIDTLVCKQGHVMKNFRVMIPYSYFELFDKGGEEVVRTPGSGPNEFWWKFRRVVNDETNQWSYWVESRLMI